MWHTCPGIRGPRGPSMIQTKIPDAGMLAASASMPMPALIVG
jgi:hypothetical protein